MLICGENTNPLARFALMAEGEQVHISSYPPVWPTRPPEDGGNYDLEQAIRIRAGAHAFEAKVYNLVASSCVDPTLRRAIEGVLGREPLRILDQSPDSLEPLPGARGWTGGEVVASHAGMRVEDEQWRGLPLQRAQQPDEESVLHAVAEVSCVERMAVVHSGHLGRGAKSSRIDSCRGSR